MCDLGRTRVLIDLCTESSHPSPVSVCGSVFSIAGALLVTTNFEGDVFFFHLKYLISLPALLRGFNAAIVPSLKLICLWHQDKQCEFSAEILLNLRI